MQQLWNVNNMLIMKGGIQ